MRKCSEMPYHTGLVLKLYPSDQQKHIVAVNDGAQRSVYNFLVGAGNEIYRMKKSVDQVPVYRDRIAYLEEASRTAAGIKNALPYLYEKDVDCQTVENGIRNYKTAWKNMREQHRGVPVFHKKSYEQSYQTNCHYSKDRTGILNGTVRFDGRKHILLPKLGRVRCAGSPKMMDAVLANPDDTRIGTVTISRDAAGEYWCSLAVSSEKPFRTAMPRVGKDLPSVCGIDVNVENFCADSDGNKVDNPRFFRDSEEKLARAQRRLARKAVRAKKEGRSLYTAKNYQEQRVKTARIHCTIQRRRSNFLNVTSRGYVKNQDVIVCEDLKVRNLLKNHCLAKAISDTSWSRFFTLLGQKAETYGRLFIQVDPRMTSQTCGSCGYELKPEERLTLSDRDWVCPACGAHLDRDSNAAGNIKMRAVTRLSATGVVQWSDIDRYRAETSSKPETASDT